MDELDSDSPSGARRKKHSSFALAACNQNRTFHYRHYRASRNSNPNQRNIDMIESRNASGYVVYQPHSTYESRNLDSSGGASVNYSEAHNSRQYRNNTEETGHQKNYRLQSEENNSQQRKHLGDKKNSYGKNKVWGRKKEYYLPRKDTLAKYNKSNKNYVADSPAVIQCSSNCALNGTDFVETGSLDLGLSDTNNEIASQDFCNTTHNIEGKQSRRCSETKNFKHEKLKNKYHDSNTRNFKKRDGGKYFARSNGLANCPENSLECASSLNCNRNNTSCHSISPQDICHQRQEATACFTSNSVNDQQPNTQHYNGRSNHIYSNSSTNQRISFPRYQRFRGRYSHKRQHELKPFFYQKLSDAAIHQDISEQSISNEGENMRNMSQDGFQASLDAAQRKLETIPLISSSENCTDDCDSNEQKESKHLTLQTSNREKDNWTSQKNKDCFHADVTQRERLTHQLKAGDYECMVCCEAIRNRDSIWNCTNCYHIFHLHCIRKWARSPAAIVQDVGWRCPTCQHISEKVPYSYYCFCGKVRNPEWNNYITPHSCGEVCGQRHSNKNCPHRCVLLCHPGPCPNCTVIVNRTCECGKTTKLLPCDQSSALTCDKICGKTLSCGRHSCQQSCHLGHCQLCKVSVSQVCYCGKTSREVLCMPDILPSCQFSCNLPCGQKLACGNHLCKEPCHPGICQPCSLLPELVTHCPCGKTTIDELNDSMKRKHCFDPIPVCDKLCERQLSCGPKGNSHKCQVTCHMNNCPPCKLTTPFKCQCGSITKEYPCVELENVTELRCEKRCNKRKQCGRHKCLSTCCTNTEHICELTCNKKLGCGLHYCQEPCHKGNCPPCTNYSFDELACYCGASVRFPPVPCGTKPPECDRPCTREHPCDHPVRHTCHSDEVCPPCTALTDKWCFGHHEIRSNVACFVPGLSCGHPCNKLLPCDFHTCQNLCHEGSCLKDGTICTQPCPKLRTDCGHPCGLPCHTGSCPESPCKIQVTVTCLCGHLSEVRTCSDNSKAFHQISASFLAAKMQGIQSGQTVDISDVLGLKRKKKFHTLECNEECAVIERNRRLAAALQIENPDLSNKPGPPNYSEFLKEETKKNSSFVASVYDKLTKVVEMAKQSKQKCRSYAFPSMNGDQRHIVHELAGFFACDTQSYDQEPMRNVVVTAYREKSCVPSVSIMSVVNRDLKQRTGPVPILSQPKNLKPSTLTLTSAAATSTPLPDTKDDNSEKVIDYFDFC